MASSPQYFFGIDLGSILSVHLALVVQRLDNAIHWINRYRVDKC